MRWTLSVVLVVTALFVTACVADKDDTSVKAETVQGDTVPPTDVPSSDLGGTDEGTSEIEQDTGTGDAPTDVPAVDTAQDSASGDASTDVAQDLSAPDTAPGDADDTDVAEDGAVDAAPQDAGAADAIADVGAEDVATLEDVASPDAVTPEEGIPCLTGDPCFEDWFCKADGCGDGLEGVCAPMPLDCSDAEITGVCGCNGQTYLSPCHAAAGGTNVLGLGSCPDNTVLNCNVGQPDSCPEDEFCFGSCLGQGFCVVPEPTCVGEETKWVCGCNGVNYTNPCMAMKLGTNVKHAGYCEGSNEPAQDCGGPEGVSCPEDEYCNVIGCEPDKAGKCTGVANIAEGKAGILCLPGEPQECGCDGVTYLNKCQRILAEVAKAKDGPCDGPPSCAVENGNADCPLGLKCKGGIGMCNGEGTCGTVDFICCLIGAQEVCGCDGKTYSCACSAHKAGIPIQKTGACGEP